MTRASLGRALTAIVGERQVLQRPSELLVYASDGLPGYRHQPALAVFPRTRDEVVAVDLLAALVDSDHAIGVAVEGEPGIGARRHHA